MKVMLSNTPLGQEKGLRLRRGRNVLRPSTGMLYLASMLKAQPKLGFPKVADVILEEPNLEGSRERISAFGPDIFGVTAYEFNIREVRDLVQSVKSENPDTLVFIGGPTATEAPNFVMHFTGADAVFRGEADLTFRRVVEHLDQGGKLQDVDEAGVLVRDGERTVSTASSKQRPVLSKDDYEAIEPDIGLIAELDDKADYFGIDFAFSRGCPYARCSFCQIAPVGRHRKLSHEKAMGIIKEIHSFARRKSLVFGDGTFGGGNKGAKALLRSIIDNYLHFNVMFAEVSVPMFLENGEFGQRNPDMELLSLMRLAGMNVFEMGVESLVESQLKKFNKHRYTYDEVLRVFEAMRSIGHNGFAPTHLMSVDSTAEEVVEGIRKSFEVKNRFGKILSVSDMVSPFLGTGEYRKIMRYMQDQPMSGFMLRRTLEDMGAVIDLRDYGDKHPFIFIHAIPMEDPLLLKACISASPVRMTAPPHLEEEIGMDDFNMLMHLAGIRFAMEGNYGDRERALDREIDRAFEAAMQSDEHGMTVYMVKMASELSTLV
jgi:hypothetical protein